MTTTELIERCKPLVGYGFPSEVKWDAIAVWWHKAAAALVKELDAARIDHEVFLHSAMAECDRLRGLHRQLAERVAAQGELLRSFC